LQVSPDGQSEMEHVPPQSSDCPPHSVKLSPFDTRMQFGGHSQRPNPLQTSPDAQ